VIALSVKINNRTAIVAGHPEMSVLTSIVTAVGRLGPESAGPERREPADLELDLRVGGMTAPSENEKAEHLNWVRQDLTIGDEITIKVIETEDVVPPNERKPVQPPYDQERRTFENARATYLQLREKFEKDETR
jgi:hypothetical protein